VIGPRYSKEEFARRGDEIYERDIVSRFGPDDEGKFVVIDIETGAYEVDRDERCPAGVLRLGGPLHRPGQRADARPCHIAGQRGYHVCRRPLQRPLPAVTRPGRTR
jgi:hypothetical protein